MQPPAPGRSTATTCVQCISTAAAAGAGASPSCFCSLGRPMGAGLPCVADEQRDGSQARHGIGQQLGDDLTDHSMPSVAVRVGGVIEKDLREDVPSVNKAAQAEVQNSSLCVNSNLLCRKGVKGV